MSPDWAGCGRTAGASVLMTAPSTGHRSWMCFKRHPPGKHIPPRNSHLSSHQQFRLQRQPPHLPRLRLWLWADRWHENVFWTVYTNMKSVRSISYDHAEEYAITKGLQPNLHDRRHTGTNTGFIWKIHFHSPRTTSLLHATGKFYTSKVLRHLGDFQRTVFSSKVVKACSKASGWKLHPGFHCRNHR